MTVISLSEVLIMSIVVSAFSVFCYCLGLKNGKDTKFSKCVSCNKWITEKEFENNQYVGGNSLGEYWCVKCSQVVDDASQ